jgi:HSP20 family protein
MSLIKWDPFRDLDEGFGRYFPGMLGRVRRGNNEYEELADWMPAADISESDTEYLIRAELPAVGKDAIKLTVDQGLLTIRGERKKDNETKNEKFHRVETFRGIFARTFTIPDNVDENEVRADVKDGVLTVHLPKSQKYKGKPVEVAVQ